MGISSTTLSMLVNGANSESLVSKFACATLLVYNPVAPSTNIPKLIVKIRL